MKNTLSSLYTWILILSALLLLSCQTENVPGNMKDTQLGVLRYQISSIDDFSTARLSKLSKRTSLKIILGDTVATQEAIRRTLLAVTQTQRPFSAGMLTWSRDGRDWSGDKALSNNGEYQPGKALDRSEPHPIVANIPLATRKQVFEEVAIAERQAMQRASAYQQSHSFLDIQAKLMIDNIKEVLHRRRISPEKYQAIKVEGV